MDNSPERPSISSMHHLALTVSDVETSAAWYERVLGLQRLPAPFPHHGHESPGYGILLVDPGGGWAVGVHRHESYRAEAADESRTGMDHVGLMVAQRSDLDDWAARLDQLGVGHSGVSDVSDPMPYSALVFRDPDNIQLEFVHVPG